MKKVTFILVFLIVSFGTFAQEKTNVKRSDLRGPAYKNYKPSKHKTVTPAIYIVSNKKSLTGPAYKNYKPWRDTTKMETVLINTGGTERQKLMGPAYKNYKPWKKSPRNKVR